MAAGPCTAPLCPDICRSVTDRGPDTSTCCCHGAFGAQTAAAAQPWCQIRATSLDGGVGESGCRVGIPGTVHPNGSALPGGDHSFFLCPSHKGDLLMPTNCLQTSTRSPNASSVRSSSALPALPPPSPCPKTPPALPVQPTQRPAQSQNKPTSDRSKRGGACWSDWNRRDSRAVSNGADPHLAAQRGDGAFPPCLGAPVPQGPLPAPLPVPVQRAVRTAASALWQRREGAASSMPGVTEPD